MATPDLSQLKHSLVNSPLHFYTEEKEDGTEVLRHIRVQQKTYEVPADGITVDTVPADSVGPEQIQNGAVDSRAIQDESVEMQDLSPEVRAAMENQFATDNEVKDALGL